MSQTVKASPDPFELACLLSGASREEIRDVGNGIIDLSVFRNLDKTEQLIGHLPARALYGMLLATYLNEFAQKAQANKTSPSEAPTANCESILDMLKIVHARLHD